MRFRFLPVLTICLAFSTAAHAQFGGGGGGPGGGGPGGGGGGGGGGHGHRGGSPSSTGSTSSAPPETPARPSQPLNQIEIVGVIRAIGPEPDRLTIDYNEVEALNWPAGSKPFVVNKTALLKGVTVGEKVRFKLDSQQISDLKPF